MFLYNANYNELTELLSMLKLSFLITWQRLCVYLLSDCYIGTYP